MSFVGYDKYGQPQLKLNAKLGSIISNSLIIEELHRFFIDKRFQILVDVGCGTRSYAAIYEPHCQQSYGFDVSHSLHDLSRASFLATTTQIPVASNTVDVVLCTEVLEHVAEPSIALAEMSRITRPGGWLVLTTPFLLSVHEAPYDFYRYTEYGLRYLLNQIGYDIEKLSYKGELFGVWLSSTLWFQTKFWLMCCRLTKRKFWYTTQNPLLWMGVILPQKLYLMFYRWICRTYPSLLRKLNHATLGYIVVAHKR